MAMTDLTGTKWRLAGFEYDVYQSDGWVYQINFISNNETFDNLGFNYTYVPATNPQEPAIYAGNFYYGETDIVTIQSLTDGLVEVPSEYQTISITGGTDATNSDLIAWLQSNATQITEPSNPISIGNLPIANMYFGTRQVKKVYLGNTLVWEKEVTLISFNVRGNSYQAEEGMTWAEWCASAYNTDGFFVTDDKIEVPSGTAFVAGVTSSDIIVANYDYNTMGGGVGA